MLFKWENIQTRTELEHLIKDLLKNSLTEKIARAFFLSLPFMSKDGAEYISDVSLYIMFENGKCLIVDLMQPSEISLDYRELTEDEQKRHAELPDKFKDIFNGTHDVYHVKQNVAWSNKLNTELVAKEIRSLKYGKIKEMKINSFSHGFEKWVGGEIVDTPDGGDYFDRLAVVMDNGGVINITAAPAEEDFYCYVCADGTPDIYSYKTVKV